MNIIEKYCGYRAAHYDPNYEIQIKQALSVGEIQGLVVRYSKDISDYSTEWLSGFPELKVLGLAGFPSTLNLSGLKKLEKLEQLLLDSNYSPPIIDFLWFPCLKSIALDWQTDVFKNTHLNNLEEIRIWKYGNKDLAELDAFKQVRHLELVQAKCQSLDGIAKFHKLENLDIYYMSKLTDISELVLDSLRSLIIENSKKITDYSSIGECQNLEKLYIHHSAPIGSLGFVKKLKALKSFRFMNTDILDGDMSPLLYIPDVYFTQKRHFSHKLSDFTRPST